MAWESFSAKQLYDFKEYIRSNPARSTSFIAGVLGVSLSLIRALRRELEEELKPFSETVQEDSVRNAVVVQKLRDKQRIERATFRAEARKLNSNNALFTELIEIIKDRAEPVKTDERPFLANIEAPTMILQISDTHFGTSTMLPNNVVNFKVLSQRMYQYISKVLALCKGFSPRRCVVLFTGDLCTSDRRPSEFLTNEATTASAMMVAYDVFTQAIETVNSSCPVSTVVSVLGNESRIHNDLLQDAQLFLHNFDAILHNMLAARFHEMITFEPIISPVEKILSVDGVEILAAHGIVKNHSNPEKILSYYRAKYGEKAVDYVIHGHIHQSLVSHNFSRSASLVAGNTFSEHTLGIPNSLASQTVHFVVNKEVVSIPIDLSNTDEDSDYFAFTPPLSRSNKINVRCVL